jgi:hypothetical protein
MLAAMDTMAMVPVFTVNDGPTVVRSVYVVDAVVWRVTTLALPGALATIAFAAVLMNICDAAVALAVGHSLRLSRTY